MLRGISRDYVMNVIGPELGYEVIEKNIEPYDVYTADEAFMTGTPFCMLPVTSLNDVNIGEGKVGEHFNKLLKQWSLNMDLDIAAQIQKWNEEDGDIVTGPSPYKFKSK